MRRSTTACTWPCVYKPVAGERPLWDFPSRTLANRERAAYLVSEALGWEVVPLTVLRDGPHGPRHGAAVVRAGRLRRGLDAVDLCPAGAVPEGYLHVLDATDGSGEDVSLVHEDSTPLRRMAVFDAVVNNADRKGGHVLAMADGHRYGVDHGVCVPRRGQAPDGALGLGRRAGSTPRTGWRSPPWPNGCATPRTATLAALRELLDPEEVACLARRCLQLTRRGRMPVPSGSWPSIPWPAF